MLMAVCKKTGCASRVQSVCLSAMAGGTYTEHLSYYHVNIKDPTEVG